MSVLAKCTFKCQAPVDGRKRIVYPGEVVNFLIDEFDQKKHPFLKFFDPADIFTGFDEDDKEASVIRRIFGK